MIGTTPFLLELAFVLFLLILGGGFYKHWRSTRLRRDIVGIVFIFVFLLIIGNRFTGHLMGYRSFRSLSLDEVASIEINGKRVKAEGDLANIISSLNEAEWYSYNHGGVAKGVWMVITTKSGEKQRYVVSYFLREEGAVIELRRKWGKINVSYGELFCRKLPTVLEQIGMPLPKTE